MPRRKDEPGFTRRRFLKTVGPCGVTAGVLTQASAVEREPGVEQSVMSLYSFGFSSAEGWHGYGGGPDKCRSGG